MNIKLVYGLTTALSKLTVFLWSATIQAYCQVHNIGCMKNLNPYKHDICFLFVQLRIRKRKNQKLLVCVATQLPPPSEELSPKVDEFVGKLKTRWRWLDNSTLEILPVARSPPPATSTSRSNKETQARTCTLTLTHKHAHTLIPTSKENYCFTVVLAKLRQHSS